MRPQPRLVSPVTLTLRRALCLDIAGKHELTDVFTALADDADARVVILRSEHPAGPALGGGCELVLGCDLAFCTRHATFGQIEANGGVVPALGGTSRPVRRVGYQRACQMIFTAAILDAVAAKEYGLVLDAFGAFRASRPLPSLYTVERVYGPVSCRPGG
jgi:enoyl-CoA hydratase/carnithine racemase